MAARVRAVRRSWSLEEKRRIVELTLREGASARAIALEHDVDPATLYHWRTKFRAERSTSASVVGGATFLPVRVGSSSTPNRSTVVEVSFGSGVTVRLESDRLDSAMLCALVAELRQ